MKKVLNFISGHFKLLILKLFHFKNFNYKFLTKINLSTEIELRGKGTIIFGKKFIANKYSRISTFSKGFIKFGDYCGIGRNVQVVSHDNITIGNNVKIGPNTVIYDHDHDYSEEFQNRKNKYKTSPISIGNNVWIGANCVILGGTIIGDNSVVAAGTVLKGTYEADSLIVQKKQTTIKKWKDK